MGDPATGSQRLTMAGGVNNLGATVGPLLVSIAIFGSVSAGNTEASIESVKIPYLVLGAAFVLVAVLLRLSSVPNHVELSATVPQVQPGQITRQTADLRSLTRSWSWA